MFVQLEYPCKGRAGGALRILVSLVPRLPPCFYLACGRKISTAGEIKARGKPGNETSY